MSDGSDKLARTRLAIIEHIQVKKEGGKHRAKGHDAGHDAEQANEAGTRQRRFSGFADAGREYWRQHPARLALQLVTPALSNYARRQPLRFIGFAAAAGALVVLARPWKLISVTGIAVAALRSPQLSSLVMQAVSAGRFGEDAQEPE